ncbi:DUF302 domain-containing protein [Ornithinimicrobium cerasi]|uniref:DUF302 domain-containing protein n=1 Tax=Ornithinimicrobium cerasi TaxID=2248773 RepID=UPI000EFF1344|nr:DUF302 domain-containing protein [Ornithinimicrobium cerasi]
MSYTFGVTVPRDHPSTVEATRAAIADQGFGILTEIDLAATLREKLGVEVPAHLVLGACRPPLAHRALQIDPSIGTVLPCNVAVRDLGDGRTMVGAFDPAAMETLAGAAFAEVAAEAAGRLRAALDAVASAPGS